MAKHGTSLLLAIVLAVIFFIITMVFSALAAQGKRKCPLGGRGVSVLRAWTMT